MKTKKVALRVRRIFSEELRKRIVKDYESGKMTVGELSRLYEVKAASIYRWIARYSGLEKQHVRVVEMKESSGKKLKEMEQRIQELERMVGQKQIQLEFYEKMVEIAKEEFGIDLKKNSSTPRSGGSEQAKKG